MSKIVDASPNKTFMDHSVINCALLVKPTGHIANNSSKMGTIIHVFNSEKKIIYKIIDQFIYYTSTILKYIIFFFLNRVDTFLEVSTTVSNSQYSFRNDLSCPDRLT